MLVLHPPLLLMLMFCVALGSNCHVLLLPAVCWVIFAGVFPAIVSVLLLLLSIAASCYFPLFTISVSLLLCLCRVLALCCKSSSLVVSCCLLYVVFRSFMLLFLFRVVIDACLFVLAYFAV